VGVAMEARVAETVIAVGSRQSVPSRRQVVRHLSAQLAVSPVVPAWLSGNGQRAEPYSNCSANLYETPALAASSSSISASVPPC